MNRYKNESLSPELAPKPGESPVRCKTRAALTNLTNASPKIQRSHFTASGTKRSLHFATPDTKVPLLDLSFRTSIDQSPAQTQEKLKKTNGELLKKLNERHLTDSVCRKQLTHQLESAKAERMRLTKQLRKSRTALKQRDSLTCSLTSLPSFHLEQLEHKDHKIQKLEEELGHTKARLKAAEDGLERVAKACESGWPSSSCPEQLADKIHRSIKADKESAKNLKEALGEMVELIDRYKRRCSVLDEKNMAMRALAEKRQMVIEEQQGRIEELLGELEDARSNSWQHIEQLQQLEHAMQQAHDTISRQARKLHENDQEREHLQASLDAAEACLEEEQQRVEALLQHRGE
uniref:Uncharacterized protein n=1 Tax=Tetraselmis sp. GSL018 TaxID=582737 RepID=A0A061SFG9_9CHLO|mmetsp:Transcript_16046/g.38043  ORF Transcript_16046/g.38043 Transcript_16046/m.38043 type:complete len:348 (-) Transcript_16046:52-1095(-)